MSRRARSAGLPGTVAAALAVMLGYYVGANVGFILRLPPTAPSVMWPPNAILTATLLLAAPRRWPLYLLAALPAHLAAAVGSFPLPLVLAWFVTNCSEALIGAGGVRLLSDAPARFDTLRRVVVFIVSAVFLSPIVTSFFDAAAVAAFIGEPYWTVWRTRFLSNALTELTLVPMLVTVIRAGPETLRASSPGRRLEAALFSVVVVLVGVGVFMGPSQDPGAIPGAPLTTVAFLIPFVLAAAVRFGPGGASSALLTTALIATLAATHDRGPFAGRPLAESIVAVQILLIIMAIPLLVLAALVDERRRAQAALADRLRFEEFLSRLSRAFVHLPVAAIDSEVESWLRRLGEFLGVDRVALLHLKSEERLSVAYVWMAPAIELASPFPVEPCVPWVTSRLLRDEAVVLPRVSDLPADAVGDAETFRRLGVRSSLTIPLVAGGTVLGGLAFSTVTAEREWPDALVQRLRLVAEVLASALARAAAEDAVRASELMKSSILASMASGVAVLDEQGSVIAVNDSWRRLGRETDTWNSLVEVGVDYLALCRRAADSGDVHAREVLAGVEGILGGSRDGDALEFAVGRPGPDRWFAMTIVRLNRPEGGLVLSMSEETGRKRAELDAQRSREELAHFTRVSTMGELASSLAHELNQPLTGILTNAQAARRLLQMSPPDLGEVHGALSDIIDDDKRAGEVIQRVRELLRKGDARRARVDLNGLIRDMVKLLRSDAVIRNVSIDVELDPALPTVTGDPIQLQQVILNLLLNAMDAMREAGATDEPIVVRTACDESGAVRVSVVDAGPGLSHQGDRLFDPFYTTKPDGMGMGLSIARSIVTAHGGVIWATPNPARGAAFHFTLPREPSG